MFEHGLTIFPSRGLDQSILVAVLVGIFVLLVLTETLGWVWAGLVVPGYLASVFVIQPSSGIAICIEAIGTFVICRLISDIFSKGGGWSSFFGRERFFLIVLVSVLVRQACELWLLVDLMAGLERLTGYSLGNFQLSSIGLVLVPLLANMAWKLSLPRAVWQVGITVVVTWAIVALVLLRYTNLSYSSLELTYENVALDFLGSPKAYIILLSSAFIAARLNLSYGWDYNGILVPSLLALTWFEPRLAVSTVIEAVVLVVVGKFTLSIPLLRRRNLEGPRKLALVFTLGFVLKLAVGWVFVVWWPLLRLTDLFGFGYVLTSLIAVKMITLNKSGRVLLPAIAVSLVGFLVGSGIGYGLEQIAPRAAPPRDPKPLRSAASTRLTRSPIGVALIAASRAQGLDASRISPAQLSEYGRLWRAIDGWLDAGGTTSAPVVATAERLGLRIVRLTGERECWALVDGQEALAMQRGWESAVLCPGSKGPILEVLRPRTEHPVALSAVGVCDRLQCAAIVFSGADVKGELRIAPSFVEAHGQLAHRPIIELRADPAVTAGRPVLHVRHVLPDAVRVTTLWPGEIVLSWDPPAAANPLWAAAAPRTVLRIHPDALWSSLVHAAPALPVQSAISVFGWVDQWQVATRTPPPPSETELLVLEQFVVAPLIERPTSRVTAIGEVARALDHELRWLPDGAGLAHGAWILAGREDRGWIALAIAAEPKVPLVVEAPRPRGESGTGRLAAATWQSSEAAALLLDPEWADLGLEEQVAYGNPVAPGEVATAFHAAHQALARSLSRQPSGAIVEIRGFATWRPIQHDVVVALGWPLLDRSLVPPTIAQLVAPGGLLGQIGGSPHWADGAETVAPLLGGGTPQVLYAHAVGVPFASVWIAPALRLRVSSRDSLDELRDLSEQVGATLIERSLADALTTGIALTTGSTSPIVPAPIPPSKRLPPPSQVASSQVASSVELGFRYAQTRDVAALVSLLEDRRAVVSLGWSPELRAGYVLIETRRGSTIMRSAAVLGTPAGAACASITPGPGADVEVWRAIQRWCLRLEITGSAAP
ncbi:MAG: poly-gamma-glutamate biosynthesis protein PgsC/CapC [Deltaproteobacteria bacterium]|nr:poly-gamma-glutamate biosynthesis protein PgsC/CapC [Deltaproteobacteria bacterium]